MEITDPGERYDYLAWWPEAEALGVRTARFEKQTTAVMGGVGSVPADARDKPGLVLAGKYSARVEVLQLVRRIDNMFCEFIEKNLCRTSPQGDPLRDFAAVALRHLGSQNEALVDEYCARVGILMHASPRTWYRRFNCEGSLDRAGTFGGRREGGG